MAMTLTLNTRNMLPAIRDSGFMTNRPAAQGEAAPRSGGRTKVVIGPTYEEKST